MKGIRAILSRLTHHHEKRTERKPGRVEKEDFLLKQIDEFREKAKQLQGLLSSKETKVQELQSIVDEREDQAKELQTVLNERKEQAEELLTGVQSQMDDMISQVEVKLNNLAEKIEHDVNDTTGRTAASTEELKASLTEISAQLDRMKAELSEKIHTEDVKCYRNMQKLIEDLTAKLEENDRLEEHMTVIKGNMKCLTWFSVLNFIVLIAFILYSLGIFNF